VVAVLQGHGKTVRPLAALALQVLVNMSVNAATRDVLIDLATQAVLDTMVAYADVDVFQEYAACLFRALASASASEASRKDKLQVAVPVLVRGRR
jgi:hypothetical protein